MNVAKAKITATLRKVGKTWNSTRRNVENFVQLCANACPLAMTLETQPSRAWNKGCEGTVEESKPQHDSKLPVSQHTAVCLLRFETFFPGYKPTRL